MYARHNWDQQRQYDQNDQYSDGRHQEHHYHRQEFDSSEYITNDENNDFMNKIWKVEKIAHDSDDGWNKSDFQKGNVADSRYQYEERLPYDDGPRQDYDNWEQQRPLTVLEYDHDWNESQEEVPNGISMNKHYRNDGVNISIPTRSLADEALASPQESQMSMERFSHTHPPRPESNTYLERILEEDKKLKGKNQNQQKIWELLDPKDDVQSRIMTPSDGKKISTKNGVMSNRSSTRSEQEQKALDEAYRDLMLIPRPNLRQSREKIAIRKNTKQYRPKKANTTGSTRTSGTEASSHTNSTLSTLDSSYPSSAYKETRKSEMRSAHNDVDGMIGSRSSTFSSSMRKSHYSEESLTSTMQSFASYGVSTRASADTEDIEKLRQDLWAAKLNHKFRSKSERHTQEDSKMTLLGDKMMNEVPGLDQTKRIEPRESESESANSTLLEKVRENQIIGLGPNRHTYLVDEQNEQEEAEFEPEVEDARIEPEKRWTGSKLINVNQVPQFEVPTPERKRAEKKVVEIPKRPAAPSPVPNTYHMYVAYSRFSDKADEVIQICEHSSRPTPNHKAGEVLVKVRSSSVSISDCDIRRGARPEVKLSPYIIPGTAFCGQIPKSEKKSAFSKIVPGDLVMSLQLKGSNARYVCAPKDQLVKVSQAVNPDEALCLAETYLTAFQTLHLGQKSSLRYHENSLKGRSVLIMVGGYSSLARAFIEVANAGGVDCCYVITKEKDFSTVAKLGAIPLARDPHQWLTLVGRQVDLIVACDDHRLHTEVITKDHLKALNNEGEVVIIGQPGVDKSLPFEESTKGHVSKLICKSNRPTLQDRSQSYNVFDSWDKDIKQSKRDLEYLLSLLEKRKVRPQVIQKIPLSKIAKAQSIVDSKRLPGYFVCLPWTDENGLDQNM